MVKDDDKQVVIQKQIDIAMREEFNRLLKENKDDILLQLIVDRELDDIDLEQLKDILTGV